MKTEQEKAVSQASTRIRKARTINELTDIAVEWITIRGASYLAKENLVVYYTSHTGRKSDWTWVKLTLPEAVRVISATVMPVGDRMSDLAMLKAFQEMDKVYEFSIRSPHAVNKESRVFNYTQESNEDMRDLVIYELVQKLYSEGLYVIYADQYWEMCTVICNRLDLQFNKHIFRKIMTKHLLAFNYLYKQGPYRPLINGKKSPTIMQMNSLPSEWQDLPMSSVRAKDIVAFVTSTLR